MLEKLASTPVAKLDCHDAVYVSDDASGCDAVDALVSGGRGAALVVHGDATADSGAELVGIFTERDILLRSAAGSEWRERPIADVMTPSPVTIESSASIADAVRMMSKGGFRHLPLVDAGGKPAGVVSIRDILTCISDYFPDDVSNLPPDPSLEAHSRYGG